jgi:hypothetical protein
MKTSKATVIGALIIVFSLTVPLIVVAYSSGIFSPSETSRT